MENSKNNKYSVESFNLMLKTAKEKIADNNELTTFQILIIESPKNNLFYDFVNYMLPNESSKENEILNKLKENEDTEISKIICMWNDGCVDLPSFHFRKSICELNEKNKDAEILLNGKDGFFVSKIDRTLK